MPEVLKEPLLDTIEKVDPRQPTQKPIRSRMWLRVTLIVVAIVLVAGFLFLAVNWSFTQAKVTANLEEATQTTVEIGRFQHTYFPYPGCIAENVTFKRRANPQESTPITVRKLTVQGSFRGLFSKRVPLLRVEGMRVVAPNPRSLGGWIPDKSTSKVVVDEYIVSGSVLEFSGEGQRPALKFDVAQLTLRPHGTNGASSFEIIARNPKPPGDLHLRGQLGPWQNKPEQTPISGSYTLTHADLGAFHGIAGIVSSSGTLQGTVGQIEIRGKTDMPDFEVTDTAHKMSLDTQFRAQVSSQNGDVDLEEVLARFGKSYVDAEGEVANRGQKGKTTSLELTVRKGRIQDFLFLFLNDQVAPVNGEFTFRGHATLPPEHGSFTRKVRLEGDFGIEAAHLANPMTQSNLERLSERAEGEKDAPPERVASDLKGHVVLREGTATFSNLSFRVPGALVRLQGTYSLTTHRIDLHGKLMMEAKLHQATSGIKSFLLKIIDPFLKKNHRGGAVFPVSVTGFYPHPVYEADPI